MLLYKLVVTVIFAALSAALVVPRLVTIFESPQWQEFILQLKSFVKAVAGGDTVYLASFQDGFTGENGAVQNLLSFLKNMLPSLVWAMIGVAFFYLLKRVVDTLCHYTVGGMLNDRMSAYAETPFSGAFVKNLGKAFTYAIVYVPLMFLYNAAMIALCYFLFFYLLRLLSSQLLLSLFLTVTFIVLAEALKMTLTGFWLPSMTTGGENIGSAMRSRGKINRVQFKKIFSVYVVSVYLIIFVNVAGAIATIGSMLLLTIPASYYLLICVQYVNYYTVTGRRYFLAYDRVFADPSRGDTAHYLDAVGAAEVDEAEADGAAADDDAGGAGDGAICDKAACDGGAESAAEDKVGADKNGGNGAE